VICIGIWSRAKKAKKAASSAARGAASATTSAATSAYDGASGAVSDIGGGIRDTVVDLKLKEMEIAAALAAKVQHAQEDANQLVLSTGAEVMIKKEAVEEFAHNRQSDIFGAAGWLVDKPADLAEWKAGYTPILDAQIGIDNWQKDRKEAKLEAAAESPTMFGIKNTLRNVVQIATAVALLEGTGDEPDDGFVDSLWVTREERLKGWEDDVAKNKQDIEDHEGQKEGQKKTAAWWRGVSDDAYDDRDTADAKAEADRREGTRWKRFKGKINFRSGGSPHIWSHFPLFDDNKDSPSVKPPPPDFPISPSGGGGGGIQV